MNLKKMTDRLLNVAGAVLLLGFSGHAIALIAEQSDDLKQAVLITLLLLAVVTFLRKRMEY
ncbi:MAG: hypothetical protein KJO85_04075 [Gammaproteobacteria bacterium]|nr:hypothetical protein [Gammaproteobacteria bacterium]